MRDAVLMLLHFYAQLLLLPLDVPIMCKLTFAIRLLGGQVQKKTKEQRKKKDLRLTYVFILNCYVNYCMIKKIMVKRLIYKISFVEGSFGLFSWSLASSDSPEIWLLIYRKDMWLYTWQSIIRPELNVYDSSEEVIHFFNAVSSVIFCQVFLPSIREGNFEHLIRQWYEMGEWQSWKRDRENILHHWLI